MKRIGNGMIGFRLVLCLCRVALALVLLPAVSCDKKRELGPPRAVPVAEDGGLRLRLMTFNIRHEGNRDSGERSWPERIAPVVRMIREERVEVIAIQEALHGQVADLWASLPEYEFLGAGRLDGKRAGEYTGLFILRERFEPDPLDRGYFWLSDTPGRAGSITWGNQYPRMVVWTRLTDRASGRSFLIYNTHWSHRHQKSRERAAELMARHLLARRRDREPVIVLGDFNATIANGAIDRLRTMSAGEKLISVYDQVHEAGKFRNTLHFWSGNVVGKLRVDHILADPSAEVVEARIRDWDKPLLSDHFPVIAELHFPAD